MSRPEAAQSEDAPSHPGLAARRAALTAISSVLDRGRMLDDARMGGTGPERAEAHGLADLTLRRLGQIDALLDAFVERRPRPPVPHILRLMAAELLFAGRPAHAVVDLGVRLAKGAGAARLGGLVNAVGRRIAAEGPALVAAQDAAALNLAPWLGERLTADWGAETARAIAAAHLSPAPHDLTLRAPGDAEAFAAELSETVPAEILPTGSVRLSGRPQLSALPGYEAGAWWAQDAAAALPAAMIDGAGIAARGARVLDLCAAPGGKTMQLAAMGHRVTALDVSADRLARLSENLARTGLEADLVAADATRWEPGGRAPFDAILLDAPCSATGTIRRHPDLQHRFDAGEIAALTALQDRLLDAAWGWLRPGGTLVFCTCSLLKAEGEERAAAFLARTPDAALLPWEGAFADGAGRMRSRPDMWAERGGVDGFFAARFRRAG